MKLDKSELLKQITVKTEVFEVPSWNNAEVKMRELTISEGRQYHQLLKDGGTIEDAIDFACRCSLVDPLFTKEEIETLNANGLAGLNEIFFNIPLIGKTQKEKEDYHKKTLESSKASKEKKEEEETEEEAEKK